jgi:hypothetical protein
MSLAHPKKQNNAHQINVDPSMFRVTPAFVVGSVIISGHTGGALYSILVMECDLTIRRKTRY